MSRPCRSQHVQRDPTCEMCHILAQDTPLGHAYRAFWQEGVTDGGEPPPAESVITCKFRGELVPLPERRKSNLGTLRDFFPCGRGFGENGFVNSCVICNPACPGFTFPDSVGTDHV